MDPHEQFCHNPGCWAYGESGLGSIVIHSQRDAGHGAVQAWLDATQALAGAVINTAYIERLNATFRARLAVLVRRCRAAARQAATLEAGMWLVGGCYNFCWPHRSLRRWRTSADPPGQHWVERIPAMAAGLTARPWPLLDLLTYRVLPPLLMMRGRRPRWFQVATRA
jgi:hypothetical protein